MARAPRFAQVDPRHPFQAALLPALAALVVLAAIGVALFYFTPPKEIATAQILQTATFPVHSVAKANLGTPGTLGQAETNDEMYVLCQVKVASKLDKLPLFIQEESGALTTATGEELRHTAASASDIPRLFMAYPTAATLPATPLKRETKIDPGQSAEGLVLVHFPVSQDAWDQRKSASITISFYQQAPITLSIPFGK